jgi:hypothetical protein
VNQDSSNLLLLASHNRWGNGIDRFCEFCFRLGFVNCRVSGGIDNQVWLEFTDNLTNAIRLRLNPLFGAQPR